MKRNNIIYIFILSILMLSIRNTYAATSIVSFKNSSGGHIVSMTMTYQLDKKEYSPGETINIIQQAGIGHITCSNGTALDRAFEPRLILEMGSPDKSKFLQYLSQTTTNAPIYFNSIDKIIYKNGDVLLNTNDPLDYLLDDEGKIVKPNSINPSSLYLDGAGYIRANYERSCDNDLGCYELALNGKLYHDSSLINYGYMLIENFTPTLMTISTNQNPIKSGTYVLGKRNISPVFIPNNAVPGEYVSMLSIYPSWTSTVNPNSPNTGSWNNYQSNINTKINKFANITSTLINLFDIKRAEAKMLPIPFDGEDPGLGGGGYIPPTPPPATCSGWWCDIDFYSVSFSEPFTIKGSTPPAASQEINLKIK